jgi:hypothetical protein
VSESAQYCQFLNQHTKEEDCDLQFRVSQKDEKFPLHSLFVELGAGRVSDLKPEPIESQGPECSVCAYKQQRVTSHVDALERIATYDRGHGVKTGTVASARVNSVTTSRPTTHNAILFALRKSSLASVLGVLRRLRGLRRGLLLSLSLLLLPQFALTVRFVLLDIGWSQLDSSGRAAEHVDGSGAIDLENGV